jgi:predicted RNA-binding protein with PIN domain
MNYIIDGHNLIPKLGGQLDSIDDEMRLVEQLQEFCRAARAQVEVYFDRAPAGRTGTRKFGSVSAYFIREGLPADEAIIRRVIQLGKTASNWSVVTSDRRIQSSVRAAHARVLSSESFAELVRNIGPGAGAAGGNQPAGLSAAEVEEWLRVFGDKKFKNS